MFVHHPDPTFTGTAQVGAYRIPFESGRARVTQPRVLLHLQHAGYRVGEEGQVPTDDGDFVDMNTLTVAQLREYAAEHDIDVTGAKRKADYVDAIASASPTVDAVEHEAEGTGDPGEGVEVAADGTVHELTVGDGDTD
ncbi:hypothetical protein [Serinicoccus sediminis]|uniref:hypothetical protein n=1 Tax=Serinicoccus sediminis TaxID=2306021 RepID=UPI001020ADB0|nr:hypothetical protein [Serinicoccus sediminis]